MSGTLSYQFEVKYGQYASMSLQQEAFNKMITEKKQNHLLAETNSFACFVEILQTLSIGDTNRMYTKLFHIA